MEGIIPFAMHLLTKQLYLPFVGFSLFLHHPLSSSDILHMPSVMAAIHFPQHTTGSLK